MSKAEDRALEKYPILKTVLGDINYLPRICFIEGYHQAEKDLELTWEDIDMLLKISPFVDEQHCDNNREFCEEVLKRFKEQRT